MQDAVSNHHPRLYPPVVSLVISHYIASSPLTLSTPQGNATSEIAIVPLILHPTFSARDMNK